MKVNITYESLFDALRKERSTEELQELNQNFYDDVNTYISQKLHSDNKSDQQNKNIQKIVKELFERRQKKIMLMAFNQGRTDNKLVTAKLLNEEKYFFDQILQTVQKHYNLLDKVLQPEKFVNTEESTESEIKPGMQKIEFLTGLPKFLGKDLESYGPYNKGDIAELPEQLVNILLDKKRVKKV